jgi:DNA (cytosine-5)-methyltransferase 1
MTLRVLELYCGIGGFGAAAYGRAEVIAAIDQSLPAIAVYERNFPGTATYPLNLETITPEWLARFDAQMWWLSPPCQPYTVRGCFRDTADPRARSLLSLLSGIAHAGPQYLAVENVEGFIRSEVRRLLLDALRKAGYNIFERILCPTELGIPNRRPRYYLIGSLSPLLPQPELPFERRRLRGYLDPIPQVGLSVNPQQIRQFQPGFHIVDPADPVTYSTCFTSAYGQSLMYSGSYLKLDKDVRRFSPMEILRLLHFPAGFSFPTNLSLRKQWHLVGNSLSVAAVREVLRVIPAFAASA